MSARKVFADRLLDQGTEPADELEVLRRAVRIAPADPRAATESADADTRALAAEVRESITTDEALSLLFPSFARSHR